MRRIILVLILSILSNICLAYTVNDNTLLGDDDDPSNFRFCNGRSTLVRMFIRSMEREHIEPELLYTTREAKLFPKEAEFSKKWFIEKRGSSAKASLYFIDQCKKTRQAPIDKK